MHLPLKHVMVPHEHIWDEEASEGDRSCAHKGQVLFMHERGRWVGGSRDGDK